MELLPDEFKVGDRVCYNDINLMTEHGTLVYIGTGGIVKHGGNCTVRWDYTGVTSEECLCNLALVEDKIQKFISARDR